MSDATQSSHPVDELHDLTTQIEHLEMHRLCSLRRAREFENLIYESQQLKKVTSEIEKLECRKMELLDIITKDRENRIGKDAIATVLEVKDGDEFKYSIKIEAKPCSKDIIKIIHQNPNIFAIDVETTGMSTARGDRVITLNISKYSINLDKTGKFVSKKQNCYNYNFNPEKDSTKEALSIHGLTRKMTNGFPLFETAADEIVGKLNHQVFLGHNTPFDIDFLDSELKRIRKDPLKPRHILDTKVFSKMLWPEESSRLSDVVSRLRIGEQKKPHTAADDVALTVKLFVYQLNEFLDKQGV